MRLRDGQSCGIGHFAYTAWPNSIDPDPNLLLFSVVKRLAIYVRDTIRIPDSASSQEVELRNLAAKLGYQSARVFRDMPPRHARAREPRKALTALTHALRAGRIDAVTAWSLPVIGGSPTALGRLLMGLRDAGVGLLVQHVDLEGIYRFIRHIREVLATQGIAKNAPDHSLMWFAMNQSDFPDRIL